MRPLALLLLVSTLGCTGGVGAVSCSFGLPGPPPPAAGAPAVAHGDHNPHHGGVVMMKGDLHYEIVSGPEGRYRLYFSDATRSDLPASTAARASLTVIRPNESPEGISLAIDEAGESWIGTGKPVADPSATKVRLSYTIRGEEPYWIDLPFVPDPAAAATDPHSKP